MRITELVERLRKLGIDIPKSTIKRWAFTDSIIPKPITPKLRGSGHESNWPPRTVKEIAAVWAVRHLAKLSPEKIREIGQIAQRFFASPEVSYELPHNIRITTPNPSFVYDYRALTPKVVDDANLNGLVITWIAAREKVRRGMKIPSAAKVFFYWYSLTIPGKRGIDLELKNAAAELAMRPNGIVESKKVPDWHITGIIPQLSNFPWATELVLGGIDCIASKSDHDELLVFLDGTDSRKKALYAPFGYYSPTASYGPDDAPLD
jgi:hypothetical protein